MATHERIMTITYTSDEWELHTYEKMAQWLHAHGISIVGKYRWQNDIPDDESYGWQITNDKKNTYDVMIDGSLAFTGDYYSESKSAVKQMVENGIDAEMRKVTTTHEYEDWVHPSGEYLHCHFDDMIGEQKNHPAPSLHYGDDLTVIGMISPTAGGYTLQFTNSYTPSSVKNKKQIKAELVERPLDDMKCIINTLESALKSYTCNGYQLDMDIDCVSYTRSETSAKCDPETIDLVMN